jgi:acetylornithine/succinyldiaminopimelate/putrescine aminotransferase
MYDYGFFSYESKDDFLDRSREFWNPDKTDFWQDAGIDLVIDRREGYFFWDMAGRRLIDLHLNGGTYNLGHRNPELIATLEQAMQRFDIGNHHFPALARTALAEALVKVCPPNMRRVIYGASGGEATDIAIKTARHTRQRRKIVSIRKKCHAHQARGGGRRRPLQTLFWPTARTNSCRCRSTTSARWRALKPATWPAW